jgi:osmoprotectant transport system substrate-binding protein
VWRLRRVGYHKATSVVLLACVAVYAVGLSAAGMKVAYANLRPYLLWEIETVETTPPSTDVAGPGCAPVVGDQLVLLADDKKSQDSDNIVAVVNGAAATPALLGAVDKVAAILDQSTLIGLNKAATDGKTPQAAARELATRSGLTSGLSGGTGPVVVGAASFTEHQTLAELYRLALTGAGFDASVQQIANRENYEPALESGEISVVPEYAATMTAYLNRKVNGPVAGPRASGDINVTLAALRELAAKAGLAVGTPSRAHDQNAFAVTKLLAEQYGLKTMSDFAAKCSGTRTVLVGPPECPARPFCQPALQKTYGMAFGSFVEADAGGPRSKTALTTGSATIGLVFSSDGSLLPE